VYNTHFNSWLGNCSTGADVMACLSWSNATCCFDAHMNVISFFVEEKKLNANDLKKLIEIIEKGGKK